MRTLTLCLGIGILLTTACGSSNSKPGTNANGRNAVSGQCTTSATQTCTGEDAYATCLESNCDSQLKAMLGSGYASGSFSGACAAFMNCELACPCDATAATCESTCTTTNLLGDSNCAAAAMAVETCSTAAGCVQGVCTATTPTSTGPGTTTGTGSCAQVQACCATMAGTAYAASCAQVSSGGEAACAQAYAAWVQAGLCK